MAPAEKGSPPLPYMLALILVGSLLIVRPGWNAMLQDGAPGLLSAHGVGAGQRDGTE